MKTLNDFIANFHEHQTETAALFAVLVGELKSKDEQLASRDAQIAGLEKLVKAAQPAPPIPVG